MLFSIIIPVYNRPIELGELLQSINKQQYEIDFEVLIIEDGSNLKSDVIVNKFESFLHIKYYYKENSGPGDSRNFGMKKAHGDYFIVLDSDCILPEHYLKEVKDALDRKYTDAYGGADCSHPSFTHIQKAINYSMTSVLTTGGIRGGESLGNKFQLRSFNMGISKVAFIKTGGFSKQNFGEDIDLTFKLWDMGFETQFIPKAFVYHKRRSTWQQFFNQTFNFGAARPILNKMNPNTSKITYWFPSVFIIGFLFLILGWIINSQWVFILYGVYFLSIFVHSLIINKNVYIAFLSIFSTLIQFSGYGMGFLRSTFCLHILKRSVKQSFQKMFD